MMRAARSLLASPVSEFANTITCNQVFTTVLSGNVILTRVKPPTPLPLRIVEVGIAATDKATNPPAAIPFHCANCKLARSGAI